MNKKEKLEEKLRLMSEILNSPKKNDDLKKIQDRHKEVLEPLLTKKK